MELKIQEGAIMKWVQQGISQGLVQTIEQVGNLWRVQPLRAGKIVGEPKLAKPDELVQVEP